ncbi:MAG: VCBS repeat-containing protein [Anaerolineales bacterium]|nr:VCBS repeat-containing protein [Anaerolineales bacterium]
MALRIFLAGLVISLSLVSVHPGEPIRAAQVPDNPPRYWLLPALPGPASHVLSQGGQPAGRDLPSGSVQAWALSPAAAARQVGGATPDPFAIFQSYLVHAPGIEAKAVGVGDFNDDGLHDAVVTTAWPANQLLLFTQSISGTLPAAPITYTTGLAPDALEVGDVNHDSLDDVVVANRLGNSISVFLQQPAGHFGAPVTYPTDDFPDALTVDDLNNDGRQDIAVSYGGEGSIGVFLQTLTGTLSSPADYSAPLSGWTDLASGDFNRDGRTDLARMNGEFSANPTISIYTQTITGSLGAPIPVDLGDTVGSGLASADLTGDGWHNLALSHGGNRPFARLSQITTTVSATLDITRTYLAYDVPETLLAADLNLDGREDILALHGGWSSLTVSLQSEQGTLYPYRRYDLPAPGASHYGPRAMAVGDLNSDGLPDVAVADPEQGLVLLYHHPLAHLQFFPLISSPLLEAETPIFDDFSDPDSGWPNIVSVYANFIYLDGEYEITNHQSYVAAFSTAGHRMHDLDVSADGRRHGAAAGGYGIAFGFTESVPVLEYYAFILWPDVQEWNLIHFEFENGFETLFWGAASNISPGQASNRMRVTRLGDEITLWVNGVPVFATLLPTYTGTRLIGFLQTPLEVGHDARYDNYDLKKP